jgi:hypothetical protein
MSDHQQEVVEKKGYQANHLILDAFHNASSTFKRISSTINHSQSVTLHQNIGDICEYVKRFGTEN